MSIHQRITDHFEKANKIKGPSWNDKSTVLLWRESLVKTVNRVVLTLTAFVVSGNFHQRAFPGATPELVRNMGPARQQALRWILKLEFLNLFTNVKHNKKKTARFG